MSKKWRIFFKVLYYFLTFSLGIFIAIVLPSANRDIVMYEFLDDYIENGEYYKAVDLLGLLYNKNEIKNENLGDNIGEIIIFETNSLLEQVINNEDNEESDDKKTKRIINASYVCIIKGLERSWFESKDKNESKILVDGQKIEILQVDLDENGDLDTVATLINSNYICFSIDQTLFPNGINSIELIKADGSSHFKLENLGLDFKSDFFSKTESFIKQYNLYYEDEFFSEEENLKLETIFNEVNKENTNYQKRGTYSLEEINKKATEKSIVFVLIYFAWIYILGDCLVGKKYIFSFIKFVYKKIKLKIKPESNDKETLALGNNFYSSVTFEIQNGNELNSDVIVSYQHETNNEYNFKCIITKKDDFKKRERVHGGIYKLLKVECKGYEVVDLPEKIEVKGYTMNIKFNIKKGI